MNIGCKSIAQSIVQLKKLSSSPRSWLWRGSCCVFPTATLLLLPLLAAAASPSNSLWSSENLLQFWSLTFLFEPKGVFTFAVVTSPPLKTLSPLLLPFLPRIASTMTTSLAIWRLCFRPLLCRQPRWLEGQFGADVLRDIRGSTWSRETDRGKRRV